MQARAQGRTRLGQMSWGTYVEATLVLVCVVEVPPTWLPPGVEESELSDESECTLRGRLREESE